MLLILRYQFSSDKEYIYTTLFVNADLQNWQDLGPDVDLPTVATITYGN